MLPLLPQIRVFTEPEETRTGGLHGRAVRELGSEGGRGGLGTWAGEAGWAGDPDLTSCPASLHSQTLERAGHLEHRPAGNRMSPCCE